jgi:hypothetical protein
MEVQMPNGVLKLRKPNVLEVYDYLESIGSLQEENAIKLRGLLIKGIAPYLDFSGVEGVNSFDDLINDADTYFKPLTQLSDELYSLVIGVLSKKA